jgi:hypothetical protein
LQQADATDTSSAAPTFWELLKMFWSEDRVDAWRAASSHPGAVRSCSNLVCLSPDAHASWAAAHFALKPIAVSDDRKRLDVTLCWLAKQPAGVRDADRVPAAVHEEPGHADPNGDGSCALFDRVTRRIVRSGDQFSIRTDDPVLRPLPDLRLLEMQWILHRVAALSGAADVDGDDVDEELELLCQDFEESECFFPF